MPLAANPESFTIQLSARAVRELHEPFYAACREKGVTGSDILRSLMESFVRITRGNDGSV